MSRGCNTGRMKNSQTKEEGRQQEYHVFDNLVHHRVLLKSVMANVLSYVLCFDQ